jgi:hypothetical protein
MTALVCASELPSPPSAGSRSVWFLTSLSCKRMSLLWVSNGWFNSSIFWGQAIYSPGSDRRRLCGTCSSSLGAKSSKHRRPKLASPICRRTTLSKNVKKRGAPNSKVYLMGPDWYDYYLWILSSGWNEPDAINSSQVTNHQNSFCIVQRAAA